MFTVLSWIVYKDFSKWSYHVFLVQCYPYILVHVKVQLNTHCTVPYFSFASIDRADIMYSRVSSHFHILLSVFGCNIFAALYLVCIAWPYAVITSLSVSTFRSPLERKMNIKSSLISCISYILSRMQIQRMLKQTTAAATKGTRKREDQAKDVGTKLKRI